MKIKFSVLGEPQGKGRPRFNRLPNGFVSTNTPEQTVLYENLIVTEYRRQCGKARFGDKDCIYMRIIAYYAIPASTSQKKRREMESGLIRPTKKPDVDNLTKVVCDALNKIAYRDDAQVVDAQVSKYYSDQPRIEVIMQNAI